MLYTVGFYTQRVDASCWLDFRCSFGAVEAQFCSLDLVHASLLFRCSLAPG